MTKLEKLPIFCYKISPQQKVFVVKSRVGLCICVLMFVCMVFLSLFLLNSTVLHLSF